MGSGRGSVRGREEGGGVARRGVGATSHTALSSTCPHTAVNLPPPHSGVGDARSGNEILACFDLNHFDKNAFSPAAEAPPAAAH